MGPEEKTHCSTLLSFELAEAARLLRRLSNRDDTEAHRALVDRGFGHVVAARIVEFLPIAYAHAFFAKKGVKLSQHFQRQLPNGQVSENRALTSEPVWHAALSFVYSEIASGVSKEDFMLLTMRSAEFHVVNQLINKGAKLENLILTPTLLRWPETGPNQG